MAAPRAPQRRSYLIVGSNEYADAMAANQVAAPPAPVAQASYIPPNVKGIANGQKVYGASFYEGLTAKEVSSIFQAYAKKERDFKYRNEELGRRAECLIRLHSVITEMQQNYSHLTPLIVSEIMSLMIPKDGWQSCDYEKVIDLSTGILAARLDHINTWLETNSLPSDFVAAIAARNEVKEKIGAEQASIAAEAEKAVNLLFAGIGGNFKELEAVKAENAALQAELAKTKSDLAAAMPFAAVGAMIFA